MSSAVSRAPDSDPRPPVSIALATYNGAEYLPDLLESLAAQDWPLEVVVSDDCSSDATMKILQDHAAILPLKLLPPGSKMGVIENFSRAIGACSSAYVALADQDDVWMPDKISRLMQKMILLEQQQEAGTPILVFCDLEVVDQKLDRLSSSFLDLAGKSKHCGKPADFLLTNHIPGCAMLANRALLLRALPIPSNFTMHDWWLALVAASFGIVDCVDAPLVRYRQHGSNTVGAPTKQSLMRKMLKIFSGSAWQRHLAWANSLRDRVNQNLHIFESRFGSLDGNRGTEAIGRLKSAAKNLSQRPPFYLQTKTGLLPHEFWTVMNAMNRKS